MSKRPRLICGMGLDKTACDECRELEPITQNGVTYFCIGHLIESRFYDKMKDCGYNLTLHHSALL